MFIFSRPKEQVNQDLNSFVIVLI